jgi:hypothetical protein
MPPGRVLSTAVVTRDIRPSTAYTACDVCGRTLLRGERAQVYLDGGARRSVCELCTSRALQEGWIREGTVPQRGDANGRSERRRSLIGRLRRRRDPAPAPEPEPPPMPEWGADEADEAWNALREAAPSPAPSPPPAPVSASRRMRHRMREQTPGQPREPRRVHAVPSSDEHKMADAVELFNGSEHKRTVAGVARSLGPPDVSVRPAGVRPGMVNIVVAWELCWYRYEIDLSEDVPTVRVIDQGSELEELAPEERQPNALADDNGSLAL